MAKTDNLPPTRATRVDPWIPCGTTRRRSTASKSPGKAGATISVALPPRYGSGESAYPVLYVLDGNLRFGAAVDTARMLSMGRAMFPEGAELPFPSPPEFIVVGIGYPAQDSHALIRESATRRMFDFTAVEDPTGEGARLKGQFSQGHPDGLPYGGAGSFLGMLQALKPELGARYRVDPATSVLYGASAGGNFAAWALFQPQAPFTHYIVASPCLYLGGEDIFEREAAWAAANTALDAKVFVSFGGRETDLFAGPAIASSATRFIEVLTRRRYERLELKFAIFPDETHARAGLFALARGIDALFGVT